MGVRGKGGVRGEGRKRGIKGALKGETNTQHVIP